MSEKRGGEVVGRREGREGREGRGEGGPSKQNRPPALLLPDIATERNI